MAKKKKKSAVRRRSPGYCGTAYTEKMSDAYWKGVSDGEDTASRMINKPPKRVRLHALAVAGDGSEPLPPAVPEEKTDKPAPYTHRAEELAVAERSTAAAVAVRHTQTEVISTPDHDQRNNAQGNIIAMNNYTQNTGTNLAENPSASLPEVTYSLKKGEIISGAMISESTAPKNQAKKTPEKKSSGIIQPWRDIPLLRKLIMPIGLFIFIFAFSPLLVGVVTIGMLPVALIGLFFFFVALFWDKIENCRNKFVNFLCYAAAIGIALGVIGMAFISGKMYSASLNTLPEGQTRTTVVVLGCRVRGDQPSLMLRNRLDTAAEYLLSNPEAYCVVTGGQGEDEEYPEAEIMKKYLVDAGVSAGRILEENKSTSTVENIEFAAVLIEKYNCHEDIAIVSDRFHQYRAQLAAENAGLNSYAMPCETRWELVVQYWFREMAGIVKTWLQGGDELPQAAQIVNNM